MTRHLNEKETKRPKEGIRPEKCSVCQKTFVSKSSWNNHFINVHQQTVNQCHICNKKFSQRNAVARHIKSVHVHEKNLKGVKDSCFGPKLHENWKENIQNFEKAWFDIYIEFDIYFSNKCHVIIEHIPQVIKRTGKSLYLSSEQVVEATHAKFAVFWERYKVNNLEKETHGTNLRSCVVEFNTRNL